MDDDLFEIVPVLPLVTGLVLVLKFKILGGIVLRLKLLQVGDVGGEEGERGGCGVFARRGGGGEVTSSLVPPMVVPTLPQDRNTHLGEAAHL